MDKRHAVGASVLLGAAVVAGLLAVTRTVELGQASSTTSTPSLEARAAALDNAEEQIRRLDASVPPALPPRASTAAIAGSRVTYVEVPSIGSEEEWGDHDDGDEWDDRGHDEPDDQGDDEDEDGWEPDDD